jgi:hypothetical protein
MEKAIYNIGNLRYFFTIVFGMNRQITKETIEIKDENGEVQSETNPKDYIITIGKSAVIVTIPNPINNIRIPYVVKRLKFVGNEVQAEFNRSMKFYIDNEGYNWVYARDNVGEFISYFKDNNKVYHFEI